jgi:TetR/AcrR family transcriptional repressor of lmrAB and yxaGH operons
LGPRKTTTRERLITTAAELFRRQGYAQTGVNQIIQEANATSGSFYHFFPAKEDLLMAVVDHIAAVFDDEIFTAAADRSAEPVEELFTILDLYRQLLGDGEFTFASPMAGLSAEVSENHPQVRARLAEIFAAWTDRIETLLRDAGDRLPPTVNRTAIAELVVCAVEGAVLGVRLNRSLEPFNAVVAQLRDYFNLLEARTAAVTAGAVTRRAAHAAPPQSADWRSW